jgi:hypothetical protein
MAAKRVTIVKTRADAYRWVLQLCNELEALLGTKSDDEDADLDARTADLTRRIHALEDVISTKKAGKS